MVRHSMTALAVGLWVMVSLATPAMAQAGGGGGNGMPTGPQGQTSFDYHRSMRLTCIDIYTGLVRLNPWQECGSTDIKIVTIYIKGGLNILGFSEGGATTRGEVYDKDGYLVSFATPKSWRLGFGRRAIVSMVFEGWKNPCADGVVEYDIPLDGESGEEVDRFSFTIKHSTPDFCSCQGEACKG